MRAYIARRLLAGLVQLFVLMLVVFVVVRATGDPTDLMLPAWASQEEQARLRASLGLDRPLPVQFAHFLANAVKGDLGNSLRGRRPVTDMLGDRLVNSAKLAVFAFVLAMLWAVPLGVLGAVRRGRAIDRLTQLVAILGLATPNFWLGIMLVLLFSLQLRVLPTSGMGGIEHYILPGITLSAFVGAGVMRLLRTSTLETLEREYIKLARVKGVAERTVIWKHAVRNALIPVVTYGGMQFGFLVGGSVVVESVFAWPGMGRLTYEAVLFRDFPVIQAVVLSLGAIIIVVNLGVDLLYGYLDPRIRQ
jgi:ABC-type dipeptide/oligopeptide/nickel transport system permease component